MNVPSQVDRPPAFVNLFISRLSKAFSIAGLIMVAASAGLASATEVILIASAPTATTQYASAEQKMATIQFFETNKREPIPNNLTAIRRALEGAGIEFIPAKSGKGVGVRLREES